MTTTRKGKWKHKPTIKKKFQASDIEKKVIKVQYNSKKLFRDVFRFYYTKSFIKKHIPTHIKLRKTNVNTYFVLNVSIYLNGLHA